MKPSEIKKIRTKLGLSQKEFAKVLGLSGANALSNIETGFRKAGRCVQNMVAILGHLSTKKASEIVTYLISQSPA